MEFLIWAGVTGVASIFGYIKTRQFVRSRLRFVDAAQGPAAPLIAGALTALLALPLSFLPFIGPSTAILLGLGVGAGVAHGSRDVKRLTSG